PTFSVHTITFSLSRVACGSVKHSPVICLSGTSFPSNQSASAFTSVLKFEGRHTKATLLEQVQPALQEELLRSPTVA
ncbi:hypothetical protein BU25DRAFT_389182, partial [Macroventuria anomochaeta]